MKTLKGLAVSDHLKDTDNQERKVEMEAFWQLVLQRCLSLCSVLSILHVKNGTGLSPEFVGVEQTQWVLVPSLWVCVQTQWELAAHSVM